MEDKNAKEPYYKRPQGADTGKQPSPAAADTKPRDASLCMNCGAKLTRDDIGLHKKIVNRGATAFLCKKCLGEKFRMTEEDCDTLIAHFKEAGCSMFF